MMWVRVSISLSITILVGSIGVVTDLRMSSALNGVNFQLGSNSVSSGPRPKSMSNILYSQLATDGLTLVGAGADGVTPVAPKLLDMVVMEDGVDEAVSEQEVTDVEKRSLLFNGSSADCEERLSTEPQLMGLVQSSSP